jgi:hypothetical protein
MRFMVSPFEEGFRSQEDLRRLPAEVYPTRHSAADRKERDMQNLSVERLEGSRERANAECGTWHGLITHATFRNPHID